MSINWPYVHLLVNHFPIILSVIGVSAAIVAEILHRRGIWLYATASLVLAGLFAIPTDITGDQAGDVMRRAWYVSRQAVAAHDDAAGWTLWVLIIGGIIAAYAFWRLVRAPEVYPLPLWLRALVIVAAVIGLATVVRTSLLGGRIVHDSPVLTASPPPGFHPVNGRPPAPASESR